MFFVRIIIPFFHHSETGEATLRIVGVTSEDDGMYTCIATNDIGSVTSSASLRVLGKNMFLFKLALHSVSKI